MEKIKPKLSSDRTTLADLKKHLILCFGTFREASQRVGISESRLHQLFLGYRVPRNPDILKKLACGWNVDLVILTRLFERLKLDREVL